MGKVKKFLKKGGIQSGKEGTALILSLLILSIMVVASLAASHSSVTGKKTALTSTKSGGAIQQSDSTAEKFISEYNNENSTDTLSAASLADCKTSSHRIEIGDNKIIMYEADGTTEIPCDDSVKKIKDIAKIKSIGADGGAKRAIEVEPPCGGVEFAAGSIKPSDNGLVGYWPFDAANQLNDITSNSNDAVKKKEGSAPDAILPALAPGDYHGREAIVFNTYGTPLNEIHHNYAEIDGDKTYYKTQNGAVSFWFYSENSDSESWVPFSKDASGCSVSGASGCGGEVQHFDVSNCDCGHLSVGYNYCSDSVCATGHGGVITNYGAYTNDKLLVRYQNDGNFGGYRLIKGGSGSGYYDLNDGWHLATVTYSASAYKFYVDGILADTFNGLDNDWNPDADTDNSGNLEAQGSNIWNINLGRHNGALTSPAVFGKSLFKGGVRELRIYNRELEACEVKRLHEMTL